MKIRYLLPLCCLLSLVSFGQTSSPDSLRRPKYGMMIWTDFGLVANQSLERLSGQLAPLGITQPGTRLASWGISSYRRHRRGDGEFRIWGFGSTGDTLAANQRGARIEGIGVGVLATYRVVDTRRFMLGPGLGYDFQFYRLRIDAPTPGSAPIQSILTNPQAYQSLKFNGGALTLNFALTAGYKFNLFRKYYDQWQLTARVGYHLPIFYNREWVYDQTVVTGLDTYRPAALYGTIGLAVFPNFSRFPGRRY